MMRAQRSFTGILTLLFCTVLCVTFAQGQDDADRLKTSTGLQSEGLKLEEQAIGIRRAFWGMDPENDDADHRTLMETRRSEMNALYEKAIEKFQKSRAKADAEASAEEDAEAKALKGEVAAGSLYFAARCRENMFPPDVASAQAFYEQVSGGYGAAKPAEWAGTKLKMKGVDVWLEELNRRVVHWQERTGSLVGELETFRSETWGLISPLGPDSVYGLIHAGLAHENDAVQAFAAEKLLDVVDGAGVQVIIDALRSDNPTLREGAGSSLKRILTQYHLGKRLDDTAAMLEGELGRVPPLPGEGLEIPEGLTEEVKQELRSINQKIQEMQQEVGDLKGQSTGDVSELKRKAGEIRKNLPDDLDLDAVQSALAAVIGDENADAETRMEAAGAISALGPLSGEMVDALLTLLASDNAAVREGGAVGAGSVDTVALKDRDRLAEVLQEMVQYEPEKDSETVFAERKWGNTPAVRAACARSLGRIGHILSIPGLVEALGDNDLNVRREANEALIRITGKDFEYEADAPRAERDPKMPDRGTREEAIGRWKGWWDETAGVVVLVERFNDFIMNWKHHSPEDLFDTEAFLSKVGFRTWHMDEEEAARTISTAEQVAALFTQEKEKQVLNIAGLGSPAIEKLRPFLGGAVDENAPQPALALFVGECIARVITETGDSSVIGELRDIVMNGGHEAAGAAGSLGALPREKVNSEVLEILSVRGLGSSDLAVQTASANALGRVGDKTTLSKLADAASSGNITVEGGKAMVVASLMAITRIAEREGGCDDEAVTLSIGAFLGDGAGDQGSTSKSDVVRAHAARALGKLSHAASAEFLIRGRRDTSLIVRESASKSIREVFEAHSDIQETAKAILIDKTRAAEDRRGAALALGEMGQGSFGTLLVYRVVDRNPPRDTRDSDASVRAACCDALGMISDGKTKSVVRGLIEALRDPIRNVRARGYVALRKIVGAETASEMTLEINVIEGKEITKKMKEFSGDVSSQEDISRFVSKWRSWYKNNESELGEDR